MHAVVADSVICLSLEIHEYHRLPAGETLPDNVAGWIQYYGISRECEALPIVTRLVASNYKDTVVKCPGSQVTHPGPVFIYGQSPGGGVWHKEDFSALDGHFRAKFREVCIIA